MIRIGIGDGSGFVYESTENYPWGPLWPAPVVMQASFIEIQDAATSMPDTQHPKLLFREDTFDPVSRIRRGASMPSAKQSSHPGAKPCHIRIPDLGTLFGKH